MKQVYRFFILLLLTAVHQTAFAQSVPQGMRYQAVARDLAGNPLKNTFISIRIGIRTGEATGDLVYQETHHVTTDQGGLFAITIGGGRTEQGHFGSIPWGSAEMWLTVALDEQGRDNFKELTASQLWSVPYAFHAGTASAFSFMDQGMEQAEAAKPCQSTGIPFWTNLGNTRVSDTCHFIGTVYAVDFVMKTNNTERMRITKDGKIQMLGLLDVEDLHVGNNADIGNNLTVDNNVDVQNNLTVDNTLTVGSRIIVNANVSGSDQNINNYPVLIQGSNQGMAIRVTGSRNNSNNFLSFWDNSGMHGRIEGQTVNEVLNSFDYIWETSMSALQAGFLGAEAGCAVADLTPCTGVLLAAQAVTLGVEWGVKTDRMTSDAGVAYESGNGDYAEWLEKADPAAQFRYGEVIGVRGGRISKNTTGADHILVISKSPIVLGNMPPPGRQPAFEKVAFMGQVPVRVAGKVAAGDYLLASGNNDGLAIAATPASMRTEDYARIVGVAWESSENLFGGMVNTAVGINTNDLAYRVDQQQRELDALKTQINQLYLRAGLPAPNTPGEIAPAADNNIPPTRTEAFTRAETEEWLEAARPYFEAALKHAKEHLEQQGADISAYPEIAALYADPVQYLKEQNEKGYLWSLFAELRGH